MGMEGVVVFLFVFIVIFVGILLWGGGVMGVCVGVLYYVCVMIDKVTYKYICMWIRNERNVS